MVAACLSGHAGIGLADRNSVAGVVRAWSQSKIIHLVNKEEPEKSFGPFLLPYHPGCRLVFSDATPDILAYPQDREAGAISAACSPRPICAKKQKRVRRFSNEAI